MAVLTPLKTDNAGALVAFVATAAGGDQAPFSGRPLTWLFQNNHASPITINIAPVVAAASGPGGAYVVPTRTVALAAGASYAFVFKQENASPYLNASGQLSATYTGHNALLVTRAVEA